MKFGWENEKDKAKRYATLPAKKKLEWLRDINEFVYKASKNVKKIKGG